jgi:hypothetical protein
VANVNDFLVKTRMRDEDEYEYIYECMGREL